MLNELNSLDELYEVFPTDQAAVDHFRKVRWPKGPVCHECGSVKVYELAGEWHKCGDCGKKFSVRHDTIFFDSKLSLRKWYAAIFLITSHRKGIASAQLARDLGVTQKTAWHMLHRIREAAKHESFQAPMLNGTVQMDETFVGGQPRNRHLGHRIRFSQARSGKKIVFGMLQHDGDLRLHHVKKIADIKPIIQKNVAPKTRVFTDEATHFKWMREPYEWNLVKHSLREYVKADGTTTNRIEGVFGHFKRSVIGVYHQVSDQHIGRYLTMFAWRWNRRDMEEGERVNAMLASTVGRQLPYKVLIGKDEREAA
jgi:transposase-like protein